MRNPWVHDDAPTAAGSGYGGRVRMLGAVVWGTLVLGVAGGAFLVGTGTVELALASSLGSAFTYVFAGAALMLVLPIILRLLAISRLLATVAFLGSGWLLGRFVWSREGERIERLVGSETGLGTGAESLNGLVELFDTLLALL